MYTKVTRIAAFAAMLTTTVAHATFLEGNLVRMSHDYPNPGSILIGPQDSVVGPGVEGDFFQQYYLVDISDAQIDVIFTGLGTFDPSGFNGVHISDVNSTISAFYSVTLDRTSFVNFDASRISFDAENIFLDLRGLNSGPNDFVLLNVAPASAPEPSTLAVTLLGLLCGSLVTSPYRRTRRAIYDSGDGHRYVVTS